MKVLFVAYYFEPFPGVGAKRVSYWAKHIGDASNNRIKATVITATPQEENNHNKDLDIIYIHDSKKSIFKNLFPLDRGITWKNDIKNYFIENAFDYDTVIITGGPFLHFSLSKYFKKERKVNVFLDFRDPFAINPLFLNQHFIKIFIKKMLEKSFIKYADKVITVNKYCSDLLLIDRKEKLLIIENGFDETIINKLSKDSFFNNKINIIYAGKLSNGREISIFLEFISKNENYIFHYVGADQDKVQKNSNIICYGVKNYRDTLQLINKADIALVLTGGYPFESTTKVFDYIGLKKNILIITNGNVDEGSLHDITKNYPNICWIKNNINSIQKIDNIKFLENLSYETYHLSRKYSLDKLIKNL